jgi:hypothetical protein
MGFTPVKPHGFPTFLDGKTPVFSTPFPDFQSLAKLSTPQEGNLAQSIFDHSLNLSPAGMGIL